MMPFLRANNTYLSLEDILIFELEPHFDKNSEKVILKVWVIGHKEPFKIPLELPHKASKAFAESLIDLIELARNGTNLKNIFDINEIVRLVKLEEKERFLLRIWLDE
jgi:hypothetical protein